MLAPRWTWPLFALVALCLVAPAADAVPNLARKAYSLAARADTRAKAAQRDSRAALAASAPGPRGDAGGAGSNGENGRDGSAGVAGRDGTSGAAGASGADGVDGLPGTNGDASVRVVTATNTGDVFVGAEVTTREEVIASVVVVREQTGTVLIQAEGEAVEIRRAPTHMTCSIDAPSVAAVRQFDVAAGARVLVGMTAAPVLSAGTHSVSFVCARSDGRTDAVVEFPAQRARISVLGA